MKNLLSLSLLGAALVTATGCYSTQEGQKKVGVPFKMDTIESRYERPVTDVFYAAKEVLGFNGTLTSENTIASTLTAKVDTKTVWVKVDEIEAGVSRINIQSRGGSGNVALAAELDKQIALKLSLTQ